MTTRRWWVKHPKLNGFLGPYREDELAAATENRSLPYDCRVLLDEGQSMFALKAAEGWTTLPEALGIAAPAGEWAPAADARHTPGERRDALRRRDRLRRQSAYPVLRWVLYGLTGLVCWVQVTTILGDPGMPFGTKLATLLAAIAGTIALAGLLFAVLDIADRCVQSAPLAEDQAAPGNADGNGDGA